MASFKNSFVDNHEHLPTLLMQLFKLEGLNNAHDYSYHNRHFIFIVIPGRCINVSTNPRSNSKTCYFKPTKRKRHSSKINIISQKLVDILNGKMLKPITPLQPQ